MRFFKIKNKIKKSSSLDLFCCNFYDNNKLVVAMSFMTPHGSRYATTVVIARPSSLKIAV